MKVVYVKKISVQAYNVFITLGYKVIIVRGV
jgi:hypothetical protein